MVVVIKSFEGHVSESEVFFEVNVVVGVNSGFECNDKRWRWKSRGRWRR